MSRLLLLSNRLRALNAKHSLKNITTENVVIAAGRRHKSNMATSKRFNEYAISSKKSFRQIEIETNAGALQDVLRRVAEIDAEITNTPVEEFKPNCRQCIAYCTAHVYNLSEVQKYISKTEDFEIVSNGRQSPADADMIHVIDKNHGGDIYMFFNGTFVCWGVSKEQQDNFYKSLDVIDPKLHLSKQAIEYVIDEDELTDIRGDVILLNPHVPSIELSKLAFSYGLGRAAKLTSIERSVDKYLKRLASLPSYLALNKGPLVHMRNKPPYRVLAGELLFIRLSIINNASGDGFLGTPDLHWAKPELQGILFIYSIDQPNIGDTNNHLTQIMSRRYLKSLMYIQEFKF